MRLISQFISGISRVLQKLPKCFDGTAISAFFVLPSAGIFPINFFVDLNDSESVKIDAAYLCNIAINFQVFLNNYHYMLSHYMLALQDPNILHYLLGYYLFWLCSQ